MAEDADMRRRGFLQTLASVAAAFIAPFRAQVAPTLFPWELCPCGARRVINTTRCMRCEEKIARWMERGVGRSMRGSNPYDRPATFMTTTPCDCGVRHPHMHVKKLPRPIGALPPGRIVAMRSIGVERS